MATTSKNNVAGPWRPADSGMVLGVDGKPVLYVAASRMDFEDVEAGNGAADQIQTLAARAPELAAALRLALDEIHNPGAARLRGFDVLKVVEGALFGLPETQLLQRPARAA